MSDLSTTVWALDKMQCGEKAVRCGNDASHGRLTVHGSGQALVCPVTACKFHVPVDQTLVAEALEEAKWKPRRVDDVQVVAAWER